MLVTGGAGFIGSHTVERLVGEGARVIVLDDFSSGKRANLAPWADDERVEVVEANVAGPYCVSSGFTATDLYITKFAVWLDADWRREHLPKVDALTAAVRARPSLAKVWARHIR